MAINVEIIAKETIKPSLPTPIHQRNFKLSFLDQLAPVFYGPLLFFYSNINYQIHTIPEISQSLKRSLSETLTRFYRLAGRIKDETSIECNDNGVVFVEAKVNCLLSEFLENPNVQMTGKLIPVEIESQEARIGCLMHIQATFFPCGGLVIGVCVSQKVSDVSTTISFMKQWATLTNAGARNELKLPVFNASIFPPREFIFPKPESKLEKEVYVTKRFVFESSKISALKLKAASEKVNDPTRVEAVTGLIWKCLINASRSNSDEFRLSILSQSVNIRARMTPPLPENTVGNFAGYFAVQAIDGELELASLVGQLRNGIQEFGENYVKKLKANDSLIAICDSFKKARQMLQEGNMDFYISSSLCKFPVYGIDFGWGKPVWVTIPSGVFKNAIVMLDTKDGDGIESLVTLSEEHMAIFQHDQELLRFACVNPSVLVSNPIIKPKSCL